MCSYNWNSTGNGQIELSIYFKKNDNTMLYIGKALMRGSCSNNPDFNVEQALTRQLELNKSYRDLGLTNPIVSRDKAKFGPTCAALKVQSIWANSQVVAWQPCAETVTTLSALINTRLIELRREALVPLLTPSSELGAQYHRTLDELDSSYHALRAFGTLLVLEHPNGR